VNFVFADVVNVRFDYKSITKLVLTFNCGLLDFGIMVLIAVHRTSKQVCILLANAKEVYTTLGAATQKRVSDEAPLL
jgi:hypothetical protein